jgi:hypothetical protein
MLTAAVMLDAQVSVVRMGARSRTISVFTDQE